MIRRTPLKRTAFKRRPLRVVRGERSALHPLTAPLGSGEGAIAQAEFTRQRKPTRTDPAFLAYVRGQKCMFDTTANPCSGGIEPHHFPAKGMGGRNGDDRLTVPACSSHHREWHRVGTVAPWERAECERAMLREQLRLVLGWMDR